ncbi:hypothetical protein GDO81_018481 [Engystomops pustulosus]|uniref:Uncharacterized protein n=1 Tax=Engystomops pustulosus TaxID=76066 RepID=A0AAV6ZSR6_ENGPU|nr:hypothetical protein GDO81_018481 [Engystomops pustulosus]
MSSLPSEWLWPLQWTSSSYLLAPGPFLFPISIGGQIWSRMYGTLWIAALTVPEIRRLVSNQLVINCHCRYPVARGLACLWTLSLTFRLPLAIP